MHVDTTRILSRKKYFLKYSTLKDRLKLHSLFIFEAHFK